jgi:hypothetical protein
VLRVEAEVLKNLALPHHWLQGLQYVLSFVNSLYSLLAEYLCSFAVGFEAPNNVVLAEVKDIACIQRLLVFFVFPPFCHP